jgi:hypothetical protein
MGGAVMGDRVVVLRADDGIGFVADACAALADAVTRVHVSKSTDADLVDTYTEMVVAYSRLIRDRLDGDPHGEVRRNIIDHLVHRLRQAQAGHITVAVVDVVDRLHAEITREPAGV